MKKALITIILIIAVIAAVGFFSLDYIFDRIVGEELESQLDMVEEYLAEKDEAQESSPDQVETPERSADKETAGKDEQSEPEPFTVQQEAPKLNSNVSKSSPLEKPEVKSSADEPVEKQEQFTALDKAKAIKIVTGGLSSSDISTLKEYASDGVSQEDISKAKALVLQKLSAEDIAELKQLYERYQNSK